MQVEALQIQESTHRVYANYLVTARTIIQQEGIVTLLTRGIIPSVQREILYSSIRMGMYDPVKNFISTYTQPKGEEITLPTKILAGMITGKDILFVFY